MEEVAKKRHRRTAEERLADLERKKQELMERQRMLLEKLDAQKEKLAMAPALRKEKLERQKRFVRSLEILAAGWDERHIIAAVEKCLSEDADQLLERGAALLEEHGKPRRGRRPKKAE